MSTLVDFQIRNRAEDGMISPYSEKQLNSTTYDIQLGRFILVEQSAVNYSTSADKWKQVDLRQSGYILEPHETVLAATAETIWLPDNIEAHLSLKSSSARNCLNHLLSNYIHPSFHGEITLELCNSSRLNEFILTEGMLIAQLRFSFLTAVPLKHYDKTGRYGGQKGPTVARKPMDDR